MNSEELPNSSASARNGQEEKHGMCARTGDPDVRADVSEQAGSGQADGELCNLIRRRHPSWQFQRRRQQHLRRVHQEPANAEPHQVRDIPSNRQWALAQQGMGAEEEMKTNRGSDTERRGGWEWERRQAVQA